VNYPFNFTILWSTQKFQTLQKKNLFIFCSSVKVFKCFKTLKDLKGYALALHRNRKHELSDVFLTNESGFPEKTFTEI